MKYINYQEFYYTNKESRRLGAPGWRILSISKDLVVQVDIIFKEKSMPLSQLIDDVLCGRVYITNPSILNKDKYWDYSDNVIYQNTPFKVREPYRFYKTYKFPNCSLVNIATGDLVDIYILTVEGVDFEVSIHKYRGFVSDIKVGLLYGIASCDCIKLMYAKGKASFDMS